MCPGKYQLLEGIGFINSLSAVFAIMGRHGEAEQDSLSEIHTPCSPLQLAIPVILGARLGIETCIERTGHGAGEVLSITPTDTLQGQMD